MDRKAYKIHIIGAGISGLIAALVLEEQGFSPVIIEATDRAGGRVKTDIIDGYQLDHGFQVLLTEYPAAQKFLDFEALELQKLMPGASIIRNREQQIIGDPLRDFSLLLPTLFSSAIPLRDKFKILKLNRKLQKQNLDNIFKKKEQTTLAYLKDFGFSDKVISCFFKPFFSGIFLENKLETSSRMFEFVYKMFGGGYAAVPKAGIEAIPKQLVQKLKNTSFKFNTKVTAIKDGEIMLIDGTKLESHFTIVATEASDLISNLKNQAPLWKSCDTLYFETEKRIIEKPFIGLIPTKNALITNIFYHTSIETKTPKDKELLSVTVVANQNLTGRLLIEKVQNELKELCGIKTSECIKHYQIPMALPNLKNIQYNITPSETRLTSQIFLAGDTLLNGSLNAAMLSGESAALGVIEALSKKI
jgi:protoporphyrinogen oxidase